MDKLQEFELYLRRQNKSKLTIISYVSDIKIFLLYLKENKIDINNINLNNLYEYKDYISNSNKKVTTINRYIVSINKYLEFLHIDLQLPQEKVQMQNFLDDIFSIEEYQQMLDTADKNNDYRAKALFSTLYLTGMRISEALSLTVHDVNKKHIVVKGKGSKYREIFVSDKLRNIWKEYLKYRIKKSDKLFTGREGGITKVTAHNIVKKYAKLVNIDFEKAHCHNFRHLCGKELSTRVPIDTVADVLGHENVNITRIYTRKTKQEILEIMDNM